MSVFMLGGYTNCRKVYKGLYGWRWMQVWGGGPVCVGGGMIGAWPSMIICIKLPLGLLGQHFISDADPDTDTC